MAGAGGRIGNGAALADGPARLEGDSAALRSALDACSAEYEVLAAGEAGRRFGIELEGEVVLELHGGIVRADRALAAFAQRIPVETGVSVLALAAGENGVTLETSAGTVEASLAVVAAGAWATPLLAGTGIELDTNVSRETVAYFDLPGSHTLPSVIDWNEATGSTHIRWPPARTSSKSASTTRARLSSPATAATPTRPWPRRRPTGCGNAIPPPTHAPPERRRASTRTSTTTASSPNGTARSSSARHARVTASSSRRPWSTGRRARVITGLSF